MGLTAAPPAVEQEVAAALEQHGFRAERLLPISAFGGEKRGRHAFRVDCTDGTTVKARYLGDPEVAARLCVLREGLGPAFAPVIARDGATLIEEWVDGRDLAAEETGDRAAGTGAILGSLHARPLADGDAVVPTAEWLATARRDLALLVDGGEVSEGAGALEARLADADPGSFSAALIHRDFCPENLIVDRDGELRVIDNEWFMVGPPGIDLGRTYHRWPAPVPRAIWGRFLDGYGSAAPQPPALDFWMLAAALWGARVYMQHKPGRLDPLRVLLAELAGGERPYEVTGDG